MSGRNRTIDGVRWWLLVTACSVAVLLGQTRSRVRGQESTPAQPPSRRITPMTKADSTSKASTLVIRGKVVSPNGKPVPGATVRAVSTWHLDLGIRESVSSQSMEAASKTNANGRFELRFANRISDATDPEYLATAQRCTVFATAEDYGFGFEIMNPHVDDDPIVIELTEPAVIRGKIVNEQGSPLAGVSIRVKRVYVPYKPITEIVKAHPRGHRGPSFGFDQCIGFVVADAIGFPTATVSDKTGSFSLRGLGQNHIAQVMIAGEHAVHDLALVVAMSPENLDSQLRMEGIERPSWLYPAEFTYRAIGAATLEGTITDAQTGRPLVGASIQVVYKDLCRTLTGQRGRFRLYGLPHDTTVELRFRGPNGEPYFQRTVSLSVPETGNPAPVDVKLRRGIWIKGKVTELSSGQPAASAMLVYTPHKSNPIWNEVIQSSPEGTTISLTRTVWSRHDGSYRLVGFPGPGFVCALPPMLQYYRIWYDDAGADVPRQHFSSVATIHRSFLSEPATIRYVDIPQGPATARVNLALDRGTSITVQFVDRRGRPVNDVIMQGKYPGGLSPEPTPRPATQAVECLGPDEQRWIVAYQPERKLATIVAIKPEDITAGRRQITLRPGAVVTGRLVKRGKPLANLKVRALAAEHLERRQSLPETTTDTQGRFSLVLVPNFRCQIVASGEEVLFSVLFDNSKPLKEGETVDLGTREYDPKTWKFKPAADGKASSNG